MGLEDFRSGIERAIIAAPFFHLRQGYVHRSSSYHHLPGRQDLYHVTIDPVDHPLREVASFKKKFKIRTSMVLQVHFPDGSGFRKQLKFSHGPVLQPIHRLETWETNVFQEYPRSSSRGSRRQQRELEKHPEKPRLECVRTSRHTITQPRDSRSKTREAHSYYGQEDVQEDPKPPRRRKPWVSKADHEPRLQPELREAMTNRSYMRPTHAYGIWDGCLEHRPENSCLALWESNDPANWFEGSECRAWSNGILDQQYDDLANPDFEKEKATGDVDIRATTREIGKQVKPTILTIPRLFADDGEETTKDATPDMETFRATQSSDFVKSLNRWYRWPPGRVKHIIQTPEEPDVPDTPRLASGPHFWDFENELWDEQEVFATLADTSSGSQGLRLGELLPVISNQRISACHGRGELSNERHPNAKAVEAEQLQLPEPTIAFSGQGSKEMEIEAPQAFLQSDDLCGLSERAWWKSHKGRKKEWRRLRFEKHHGQRDAQPDMSNSLDWLPLPTGIPLKQVKGYSTVKLHRDKRPRKHGMGGKKSDKRLWLEDSELYDWAEDGNFSDKDLFIEESFDEFHDFIYGGFFDDFWDECPGDITDEMIDDAFFEYLGLEDYY